MTIAQALLSHIPWRAAGSRETTSALPPACLTACFPVSDFLDGADLVQAAGRYLHKSADIVLQPTLALRRILQRADIVGGFQHGHRRGWGGSSLDRRWRDVGFMRSPDQAAGGPHFGVLILLSRGVRPSPGGPDVPCRTQIGMADKHITLISSLLHILFPYVMWLMRSFFVSLPRELEESAMIDGCTRYGPSSRSLCRYRGLAFSPRDLQHDPGVGRTSLRARAHKSHASTIPWPLPASPETRQRRQWAALTAVGKSRSFRRHLCNACSEVVDPRAR